MTPNGYRYVEFAFWVGSVATAVVVVLALPSLTVGNGLVTLKFALFVVGFLLFGIGSFAIQPTPHGRGPVSRLFSMSLDGGQAFGFEQRIQKLPPLGDHQLPFEDRVSRDVKVFVTSLLVLGVSIFLEVALGVSTA